MSSLPRILNNGSILWKLPNGSCHRDEDKPSYILADGSMFYYKDGKLHRDGGKPAAILKDGSTQQALNGDYIW